MQEAIKPTTQPATRDADDSDRCDTLDASVVLVPRGGDAPGSLLGALSSRGFAVTVVGDEPGVMLALAELRGRRRVMVVVEPGRCSRLDELLNAVRVYHGRVLCWRFSSDDGGAARLASFEVDRLLSEEDDRFASRDRRIDRLLVPAPGEPMSAGQIVTQQELTMLLGPASGEAS